ncbi:hypothetical protein BUALT_Bualt02G0073400 [Buddleja alternifolia]|uniref:Reverse transcriptase domain-containing protein n=1 Tax=Buddleja alternifolia TaxID=168488 RepID=A0AAV6XZK6_9LAMI|nr:hypothetical protein BUALT_Bualt02G0073400 [Buddleja alternifolia]
MLSSREKIILFPGRSPVFMVRVIILLNSSSGIFSLPLVLEALNYFTLKICGSETLRVKKLLRIHGSIKFVVLHRSFFIQKSSVLGLPLGFGIALGLDTVNVTFLLPKISSNRSKSKTIPLRITNEDLNELLKREELMWRQRAKQKWIEDGDANTRFFHLSTIIHRRYNTILSICNFDNIFVSKWQNVGACFDRFFQELFTSSLSSYPENLENLVPCMITNEDNNSLLAIPSPSEIKHTVWAMAANKTPGPTACRLCSTSLTGILLAMMLSKPVEEHNLIQGVKISRSSLPITHLMYADDLLIFGQADETNVNNIRECLEGYGSWSGQIVSKEKSIIHFSKNVPSKHHGLPFCKPASKMADYSELIDRISRKLSGWKSKCLAQVSRNVLIKSVAQSIPNYFMSLYLLPVSVCDKVDQIIRNFWWGDKEGHRGIHFRSWEFLCMPKDCGGLGLRRMKDMNRALVSKLAWGVCDDSASTWKTLLISKYLKDDQLLNQNETPRSSSKIWKSIVKGKSIVELGLCYVISAGGHIRTWEDPWIPTIEDFKPSALHLSDSDKARSYSTQFFVNQTSSTWNIDKLHSFFSHNMISEILKIRIPAPLEPRGSFGPPPNQVRFRSLVHIDRTKVLGLVKSGLGRKPSGIDFGKLNCMKD